MKNRLNQSKKELINILWKSDVKIKHLLNHSSNLLIARNNFFEYLNDLERHYFNIRSSKKYNLMHIVERNNAKECIRVLKNIIRTENEKLTSYSALDILYKLANNNSHVLKEISEGFLHEFINLFNGINGKSGITDSSFILEGTDYELSKKRTEKLNNYADKIQTKMAKFKSGLHIDIKYFRNLYKQKILIYFNATEEDWLDYKWHLKHIIKDKLTLSEISILTDSESDGLIAAKKHNIPFQITPYYLSLFDLTGQNNFDTAIRKMVLPSKSYCENVKENKTNKTDMDFMGENSTSPVECVTRRYPNIVILKPFNSCPQICVYCQRNWEIQKIEKTSFLHQKVKKAIEWIKKNKYISEVLVTGGDPLTLSNSYIENIIDELSRIDHIERIRIGTRVLVTLPMRINNGFINILERYHRPGQQEICIVTHFEHSSEITPDVLEAVQKIRKVGISIYNQQVFTYYNSKKYETSHLRKTLKLIGIDPYYTFNTKGKEETIEYRVPIARIEQERKEEARFLPGLVRTDEPVFNLPKLGKSHLRAWQDHEPIMILGTGERVYRFFPWESKVTLVEDYLYKDLPIYDYLKRLIADGENHDDYKSIWYYF